MHDFWSGVEPPPSHNAGSSESPYRGSRKIEGLHKDWTSSDELPVKVSNFGTIYVIRDVGLIGLGKERATSRSKLIVSPK